MNIDIGVHQTHCCAIHGCKYGDEYCLVVLGVVKQSYPCEDCQEHLEINGDVDDRLCDIDFQLIKLLNLRARLIDWMVVDRSKSHMKRKVFVEVAGGPLTQEAIDDIFLAVDRNMR